MAADRSRSDRISEPADHPGTAGAGPGRAPCTWRRLRRRRSRTPGSGSRRRSTDVIAVTPASSDETVPTPTAARIAAPRTAVSPTVGIATGTPRTSALMRAHASPAEGRPASRSSRTGAPAAASGSATCRSANAAPSSTARARCSRPVGQREPEEHATRLLVEDRRALPRQVRQEHEPIGAGCDPRGREEQLVRRPSVAQHDAPHPVHGCPQRGHRPAHDPQPGQRCRRQERPGHLDRAVGIDPDPAGRAAGVDRVARSAKTGAQHRCRPVVDPGDDRDAGPQAERVRRRGPQRPEPRPIRRAPAPRRTPAPRRPRAPPATAPSRGPGPWSRPRRSATGPRHPTRPGASVRGPLHRDPRGPARPCAAAARSRRPPPAGPATSARAARADASSSSATSVGPCPTAQMASRSTSASSTARERTAAARAAHQSRGSCSARPSGPTSVG